jgi:hypothetical protein
MAIVIDRLAFQTQIIIFSILVHAGEHSQKRQWATLTTPPEVHVPPRIPTTTPNPTTSAATRKHSLQPHEALLHACLGKHAPDQSQPQLPHPQRQLLTALPPTAHATSIRNAGTEPA